MVYIFSYWTLRTPKFIRVGHSATTAIALQQCNMTFATKSAVSPSACSLPHSRTTSNAMRQEHGDVQKPLAPSPPSTATIDSVFKKYCYLYHFPCSHRHHPPHLSWYTHTHITTNS